MRQNKEGLRGTGKVFFFYLRAACENKGNLITAIILLVLSIISVPAGVLLSGGGVSRGETSKISTVYYRDETGYGVDPAETAGNDAYYTGTPRFRKRIFHRKNLPIRESPLRFTCYFPWTLSMREMP